MRPDHITGNLVPFSFVRRFREDYTNPANCKTVRIFSNRKLFETCSTGIRLQTNKTKFAVEMVGFNKRPPKCLEFFLQILTNALPTRTNALLMLIVSTAMARTTASVNQDTLEMDSTVQVRKLQVEICSTRHSFTTH